MISKIQSQDLWSQVDRVPIVRWMKPDGIVHRSCQLCRIRRIIRIVFRPEFSCLAEQDCPNCLPPPSRKPATTRKTMKWLRSSTKELLETAMRLRLRRRPANLLWNNNDRCAVPTKRRIDLRFHENISFRRDSESNKKRRIRRWLYWIESQFELDYKTSFDLSRKNEAQNHAVVGRQETHQFRRGELNADQGAWMHDDTFDANKIGFPNSTIVIWVLELPH